MFKIITFSLCLVLSFNTLGMDLRISLWEKPQCPLNQICLPSGFDEVKSVSIPEPKENSFSRVSVPFEDFEVILTFTKKLDQGGYFSFQIEILDQEKAIIALCSRYEALESMERAPVGACGAYMPQEMRMVGASILLP